MTSQQRAIFAPVIERRNDNHDRQPASQKNNTYYALTDTLTEKQKEMFEDYMTAQREVSVLTDCETYCLAFKTGAKIMLDVLIDTQMREI